MVIERIDIKSFGKLKDLSLVFSDKVNVIEGENEAGKSTIAAFIKYMLYGFDNNDTDKKITERSKRINWTTGVAQGSMLIRVKDKEYLISRCTTPIVQSGRTVYREECNITDVESGATAFGKLPAGEVFFGVNMELFENTAFIGDMSDSSIDEDSVKESIENILFSGSEKQNNQRAMNRIADRMNSLLGENGENGLINELKRKKADLEDAMHRSDENNKQILAKESELHKVNQQREEVQNSLQHLYDANECYTNVMIIQTYDKLHELEESTVEKADKYQSYVSKNTRNGFYPSEQYLTDFALARKSVNDTYKNIGACEIAYCEEKNTIGITREIENAINLCDEHGGEEQLTRTSNTVNSLAVKNTALAALCGVGALAALILFLIGKGVLGALAFKIIFGVLGVVALTGGLIFGFCAYKYHKKISELCTLFGVSSHNDLKGKIEVIGEARMRRDNLIRSTENARLALEKAKTDYANAKNDLSSLVMRWGGMIPDSDVNDYLNGFEKEVSAFLEERKKLYDDKVLGELMVKDIRTKLSGYNEIDIRAKVPPLKRKILAGVNHDDITSKITADKAKLEDLGKLAFSIENELNMLKRSSGDPSEYYSKISALDEKIAELSKRHKAYFIAKMAIEKSADNLRAGISPRLEEYAADLMKIMTDGRYTDFGVSENMDVTYSDKQNEMRSIDYLSKGTKELAYISVRMALIDMLYPEKPPVCYDESFAHQDNVRARSMMKGIAHLADEGYQSFIFTCRNREAALADELSDNAEIFKLTGSIA